jgi:hypothetical protein
MGSSLIYPKEAILKNLRDGQALHLTFDSRGKLTQAIGIIKSLNLNLSCSLSAPREDTLELASQLSLDIKGVQFDLGQITASEREAHYYQSEGNSHELETRPVGTKDGLQKGPDGEPYAEPDDWAIDWIKDLVSLCGHMRISPNLAKLLVKKISGREMSPNQAAATLGHSCRCGCFNLTVAEGILVKAAEAT